MSVRKSGLISTKLSSRLIFLKFPEVHPMNIVPIPQVNGKIVVMLQVASSKWIFSENLDGKQVFCYSHGQLPHTNFGGGGYYA
jgi:hypothetical protein